MRPILNCAVNYPPITTITVINTAPVAHAGAYLSVAVVGGSVSPQILTDLQTKVAETQATLETNDASLIGALTREDLLGDLFYAGTLGYYAQYTALARLMGQQQNAQHYLAAGYGTFGYESNVDYFFGVPRAITTGGAVMNIPILNITATDSPPATAAEDKKNYLLQIGILSSALEHAVPEQLFSTDPTNPPDAISAVKALSKANAQGQRIYHITQANQGAALSNINHDQSTMDEIRNALNVGKEVITHTDVVSVPGWSGAGYIIIDPVTGDGAYKIGGGANGGWMVITTFAIIGLLILGAALSRQYSLLASFSATYWALSKRIQKLAADDEITPEDFVYKVRIALAIALTSALLPLTSTGSNPQQQAKDLAFKIMVSGVLTIFGLQIFG